MDANFLIYIALGGIVVLAIWLGLMERRLKKLFRSKKTGDLENILANIGEDLKSLQISKEKTDAYLKEVESRLRKSVKQVGILRFNPFGTSLGQGSNQSFSMAFLDEQGSGAVISCLYVRDNIKVYAKPVKEYKSEYALTPEENKAIENTCNEK